MYKQFTAWLLIVMLSTANLSQVFVYAGFQMNQKYISENLCVNRDKPWMHCNGHCYLMKKVKQAMEKEKHNERLAEKNRLPQTFFSALLKPSFHSCLLQIINTPYRTPVPPLVEQTIFHPPKLS